MKYPGIGQRRCDARHNPGQNDEPLKSPVLTLWAAAVAERLGFDRAPRSRWDRQWGLQRLCKGRQS